MVVNNMNTSGTYILIGQEVAAALASDAVLYVSVCLYLRGATRHTFWELRWPCVQHVLEPFYHGIIDHLRPTLCVNSLVLNSHVCPHYR
jgi:hypothetical protein